MNLSIIINIVLALLIAGFAFWLIEFIPVDGTFKKIAKGVIIFAMVLWIIVTLVRAFNIG